MPVASLDIRTGGSKVALQVGSRPGDRSYSLVVAACSFVKGAIAIVETQVAHKQYEVDLLVIIAIRPAGCVLNGRERQQRSQLVVETHGSRPESFKCVWTRNDNADLTTPNVHLSRTWRQHEHRRLHRR